MDDSEWEGSLQTNRDRVNCSMPADYNDSTSADSAVRLLCRLIAGADVSPLPPNRRAALLECARAHRVDRLAMHAIRMRGEPTDLWFGMAAGEPDVERTWAVLDAVRTRELHAVTATLARVSGAEPIVFKGAALAHSHYPASWLRPRLDTDVLISPSSVAAALAALEAIGYERAVSTSGELVLSQMPLTRTDSFGVEHALDLHWKIANWQAIAMVLSHDEIATRAVPLPAAGPDARAASNRDALLIACLHRTAHHRDSGELLWLYDIHLLAGEMAEADWIEFVSAGRRGEVKTLLRRSLALATERFQTRIPAFVMRQLEIGANSAPERSAVFLSTDLRLVDGLMSDLRALRGRKRAQLIAEHLFPPAAYIRQRYQPTSRISMAFYYIRRIVFGLPRWFTARRNS
jgi:hypothetical protein